MSHEYKIQTIFVLQYLYYTTGDTQIVLIDNTGTEIVARTSVWNSGFYNNPIASAVSRIKLDRLSLLNRSYWTHTSPQNAN